MHAVIVHRYFWPAPLPYAQMLRHLAGRLAREGWQVTVISTRAGGAKELKDPPPGVTVRRIPVLSERKSQWHRRIFNMFWFVSAAFIKVLRSGRPQVVMAATTPPVVAAALMGLAARLRGAEFIYHLQDIHPEASRDAGLIRAQWLYRLLLKIDTYTASHASRRVVLSADMAQAIADRGVPADGRTVAINNFYHGGKALMQTETRLPGTGLRIAFAGNLGLFQGLDIIIDALAGICAGAGKLTLILIGEGAAKRNLMARASQLPAGLVEFMPQCSAAQASALIAQADFGLVSLREGVIRHAYPSKVITYLRAGVPLLATVPPQSELGRLIEGRRLGLTAMPGDIRSIRSALERAQALAGEVPAMRRRCRAAHAELFDRARVLDRWAKLFGSLEPGESRTGAPAGKLRKNGSAR